MLLSGGTLQSASTLTQRTASMMTWPSVSVLPMVTVPSLSKRNFPTEPKSPPMGGRSRWLTVAVPSPGNHGQSIAYATRLFGAQATWTS